MPLGPLGGVDAAIATRVSGEYNRISGQGLSEEEGNLHGDLARDSNSRFQDPTRR